MTQAGKMTMIAFLLSFLCGTLWGAQNPFLPKMPLEEGIVHYRIQGSLHGERILYIKHYGAQMTSFSKTDERVIASGSDSEKVVMMDEKWVTLYDLTHKRASRYPRLSYLLVQIYRTLPPKSQKRVLENLAKLGGVAPEDILSRRYRCVDKIKGFEGYMVQRDGKQECKSLPGGMLLESKTDILGYHTATTLNRIVLQKVDPSFFVPPVRIAVKPDRRAERLQREKAARIIKLLQQEDFGAHVRLRPAPRHPQEDLHLIIEEGIRSLERTL